MTPKTRIVTDGITYRVQLRHWLRWYDLGTAHEHTTHFLLEVFNRMTKQKNTPTRIEFTTAREKNPGKFDDNFTVRRVCFKPCTFKSLTAAQSYRTAFYAHKEETPPEYKPLKKREATP